MYPGVYVYPSVVSFPDFNNKGKNVTTNVTLNNGTNQYLGFCASFEAKDMRSKSRSPRGALGHRGAKARKELTFWAGLTGCGDAGRAGGGVVARGPIPERRHNLVGNVAKKFVLITIQTFVHVN